ncbi:hypothetical protein VF21_10119 [Pseudogymnoascus sp. 05NY08]|nr:hypothetical protein VF21_10119 [Pseudogymnoascus sp. 05NY08]
MWSNALAALALLPGLIYSLASTDSIQDADPPQSGYLPNHNMDPNVVGSTSFGILWSFTSPNQYETWYAKALTYTPSGSTQQLVITASNMNIVRVMDGKTGNLVAQRQLYPPFLQSDIGCYDIPHYIGITGTPIIDPATDIMYLFAKGYKNGGSSGGVLNARYNFYALQLTNLEDATGFPVMIDGHYADNDHNRYFLGGTVLQRPSLTALNRVVVGAFGGHCDLFNYTGMLVSVSKTPGVGVVSIYAMEAAPGAPTPQPLDYTVQQGGKAGIWQSGMGLATDVSRIFIVTGNGEGHANGAFPASGHAPLSTLDEVVADFSVSSSGVFGLADYFEPHEYVSMDAADRDLGSGGTCLLDGSTFHGTGVNRIAVVVGKNAKVYILNADNLGGYMQGAGGTDNILQTIVSSNSVFGGSGSYPLEGGYFYFTPIGDSTYAYKFGTDANGVPTFTQAGKTQVQSAGRTGVGQPTITTNNGQEGSAILWVTDVDNGLRAFNAVPSTNGTLEQIPIPPTGPIQKYQRPAFGDGRLYVMGNNVLTCLGSPVNLPLQCSGPIDFGSLSTGSIDTVTINCTTLIAINQVNGCSTKNGEFQCDNSTMPSGSLAAGATFSFPVTWNLTQASINDAQNVSFGKVLPGVITTALDVYTTNGVAGYTTSVPLSLSGTVVSAGPFLYSTPSEVDFGGIVIGNNGSSSISSSVIIQNIGSSLLTFTGLAWQDTSGTSTDSSYHNVSMNGTDAVLGTVFTSSSFPKIGQTLSAGQSLTVPLLFETTSAGQYASQLTLWSDGGSTDVLLSGSAGNPPIANISVSTNEGGWDYSVPIALHFGDVFAGTTVQREIRICNQGGSVLTISRSKPPVDGQLTAVAPTTDLAEGSTIAVGQCAYGRVAVYANQQQVNHPSQDLSSVWSLNTDGKDALNPTQDFGVRDIVADVMITTRQVGPLLPNGTARYQWVGCFQDTYLGRNFPVQLNNSTMQATNTNEQCQQLCMSNGYALAGTEYRIECWCGNAIAYPQSYTPDSAGYCGFTCPGDSTEACGGFTGYICIYADTTKFNIPAFLAMESGSSSVASSTAAPTSSSASSSTPISGSSASVTSAPTSSSTTSGSSAPSSSTPTSNSLVSSSSTSSPSTPSHVASSGGFNWVSCYTDSGARVLNENCAAFCNAGNWQLMGLEWRQECYCSNTTNAAANGVLAPTSDCNMFCSGNALEYCGGSWRLDFYAKPGALPISSSSTPVSTSAPSSASSTPASSSHFCFQLRAIDLGVYFSLQHTSIKLYASPSGSSTMSSSGSATVSGSPLNSDEPNTVKSLNDYWTYIGCYKDLVNNGQRVLSEASFAYTGMTLESCAKNCSTGTYNGKPFNIFGTEYGRECYCGYTLNTTALKAPESDCSYACSGSSTELCGAGARLSVYNNTVYNPPPPLPSHVPSVGGFNWVSCYTDSGARVLNVENCAAFCNAGNWQLMGLEWMQECYCGNTTNAAANGVPAPTSNCNMLCSGNVLEYCGAGFRLDFYAKPGPLPSSSSASPGSTASA